jgi:VIT1/CCC1 family predicted Fe2+/Mn2+ transporter
MASSLKTEKAAFVRNFIFGVEDSLVSTVGLVSGVAVAGMDRSTVLLTGLVLIVVEALSMGVGSLLAESSAEELVFRKRKSLRLPILGGGIMFISYFVAGFIPLAPYAFFEIVDAFPMSIAASVIALFTLGYASAKLLKGQPMRSGLRMLVLGGLAIGAGALIGHFLGR